MTWKAARDLGSLSGYEILHELKRGGMGEVLLARKKGAHGFQRLVAIKTIRPDLSGMDKVRTMFQDEARLMARLHHPAIAQVIDFAEEDGVLCLIMEYVAGVSFSSVIDKEPPVAICCQAIAHVCRGLHVAHELDDAGVPLGVVHRDVSPPNLMMSFDGAVKILDFGIAWMRGRQAPETEFGTVKGKPPYMAPEQLRNDPIDRRTDVFAAANILHEMLTGERLFEGDSPYAVARAIEFADIAPPSEKVSGLPEMLDDIVMKGLAKNPDDRYATAEDMANDLDAVAGQLSGESLETWAKRELALERGQHKAMIKELITAFASTEHAAAAPIGRPSGVLTAVDDDQVAALMADEAHKTGDPEPTPIDVPPDRSSGRWVVAIAATVAVLAAAAAVVWVASREQTVASAREDAASAADVDAAHVAPDAASPTTADAAVPAAVDATIPASVDARPRTGSHGSRRPPPPPLEKPDAGAKAPPPDKPPAVPTFGFITFGAEPYALIKLDGQSLGSTPKIKLKVTTGRHKVELISPDSGKVRVSKTVTVEEGVTYRVIAK